MKSWDIVRGMETRSIDMLERKHCIVVFEVGVDKFRRESADRVLELERQTRPFEKARNLIMDSGRFSDENHNERSWMLIITPSGVDGGMDELMGLLEINIGELWHHGNRDTHLKWYIEQSSIINPGIVVGNVLDILTGNDRLIRAQRQNVKRTW
jgi:hypothetical protein